MTKKLESTEACFAMPAKTDKPNKSDKIKNAKIRQKIWKQWCQEAADYKYCKYAQVNSLYWKTGVKWLHSRFQMIRC